MYLPFGSSFSSLYYDVFWSGKPRWAWRRGHTVDEDVLVDDMSDGEDDVEWGLLQRALLNVSNEECEGMFSDFLLRKVEEKMTCMANTYENVTCFRGRLFNQKVSIQFSFSIRLCTCLMPFRIYYGKDFWGRYISMFWKQRRFSTVYLSQLKQEKIEPKHIV